MTHLCAHAEDREDLKVFEEGISQPKASHAAWSAAASSLQMRNALPEVRPAMLPLDLGPLVHKDCNAARQQPCLVEGSSTMIAFDWESALPG